MIYKKKLYIISFLTLCQLKAMKSEEYQLILKLIYFENITGLLA